MVAWVSRLALCAATLAAPAMARAHATTFAMYSKYEATVVGNDIAFVFALDKGAVLRLLELDAAPAAVAPVAVDARALERYKSEFSRYLFARFFVSSDGVACTHPAELGRFFFDEATARVLAVTRFHCASEPAALTIRSLVTHDLPLPHELVGDLQYRHALVRSFFSGDDVEAHIALAALPQSAAPARTRGKFSYVALPDRERRYSALAAIELGVALRDESASDVRPLATLWHFIGQGVLHILTGYDHLLFILTLMLAVGSWRRLAVIVTSFTAAHSITLVVATLGLFTVPPRVIEPLIALSVLLVAADAFLRPQAHARAAVTFAFGLVHGFGLSNVLRELGLSGRALVPALFGFNAGVELGQLAVVACVFPLILLLRRRKDAYVPARKILCGSVALAALFWIVVRVGG